MNIIKQLAVRFGQSFALVGVAIALSGGNASAQPGLQFQFGPRATFADQSANRTDDDHFSNAAALENDPETERVLRRAQQAAEDGNYDLAIPLAQKVLDGTGGMLAFRKRQTIGDPGSRFEIHESVHREAERLLAGLPALALSGYRLTADGEAKGVLASATSGAEREAALAQVVRRFFFSSLGDDAAFELGCRLLDRREFVAASRLFRKILSEHPDSSVSRGEALARLALACARLGDRERAAAALAELRESRDRPSAVLLTLVQKEVERKTPDADRMIASANWLMQLGSANRRGRMASLPPNYLRLMLGERFGEAVEQEAPTAVTNNVPRGRRVIRVGGQYIRTDPSVPTQPLIERWKQSNWTPAGQVLLEEGRVYYRASRDVRCIDSETGELIFPTHSTAGQSLLDGSAVQMLGQVGGAMPVTGRRPAIMDEVMAFGDRLSSSMSLIDGVLYVIEPAEPEQARGGAPDLRGRPNILAAYSAHGERPNASPKAGGKLRWRRGGDPPPKPEGEETPSTSPVDTRFAAAPVACGGSIVVPVREQSSLWLYSLSPREAGRTEWKTFLCDEPRGGVAPWLPVGIAVDSGDVYVASGAGVVFCVDGGSGVVRWATRYERGAGVASYANQFGMFNQGANVPFAGWSSKGWEDNVVIPHGRLVAVLASDSEQIIAIDRTSGEVVWLAPKDSPEGSATYCLGVLDDGLYVAGVNCVRRYNLAGGLMKWELQLDPASKGRGCLTPDAIYLPVKDSILKIDPRDKKWIAQIGVKASGDTPVGNLFSNGNRLIMVGPSRISILDEVDPTATDADKKPADAEKKPADTTRERVPGAPPMKES